jgi:hypothetical protein
VLAALLVAPPFSGAAPQPRQGPETAGRPEAADIARALDAVRHDPLLAPQRTIKLLRWKRPTAPPSARPWWAAWIVGAFVWIGESMRVVVWGAAFVLVVAILGYAVHAIGRRAAAESRDENRRFLLNQRMLRRVRLRGSSVP